MIISGDANGQTERHYSYSDVACKLKHTKVRMRKGLAKDLHHFRDGITVTAIDPEADGQGNGTGATFLGIEPFDSPRSGVQGNPWDSVITGNLGSFDNLYQLVLCFIFTYASSAKMAMMPARLLW